MNDEFDNSKDGAAIARKLMYDRIIERLSLDFGQLFTFDPDSDCGVIYVENKIGKMSFIFGTHETNWGYSVFESVEALYDAEQIRSDECDFNGMRVPSDSRHENVIASAIGFSILKEMFPG